MIVLSVDPGLSLTGGTGYALFRTEAAYLAPGAPEGGLVTAGLITPTEERLEERIREIRFNLEKRCAPYGERSKIVIEKMKVYSVTKQKGAQGDLIDLAHLGGALMHLATSAVLVEPSGWKGQVPKDVVAGLVEARLAERERATLNTILEGVAKTRRHNVYEAVGIGLWYLRRWAK